jgi:hypothetical protein
VISYTYQPLSERFAIWCENGAVMALCLTAALWVANVPGALALMNHHRVLTLVAIPLSGWLHGVARRAYQQRRH